MATTYRNDSTFRRSTLLILAVAIVMGIGNYLQVICLSYDRHRVEVSDKLHQLSQDTGPLLSHSIDQELRNQISRIQHIVQFYDSSTERLKEEGQKSFLSDSSVDSFYVFNSLNEKATVQLTKGSSQRQNTLADVLKANKIRFKKEDLSEASISITNAGTDRIAFYWSSQGRQNQRNYFVVISKINSLRSIMKKASSNQSIFLMTKNGEPLLQVHSNSYFNGASMRREPMMHRNRDLASTGITHSNYKFVKFEPIFAGLQVGAAVFEPQWHWTRSFKFSANEWLPSLVAMFLVILLLIPIARAAQGIDAISYTIGRSLKGDFDVRVDVGSTYEVSWLAKGINYLLEKISIAMTQLAQKIRLESELKIAKTVQAGLFPDSEYISDGIKIYGTSESASETGGDWWFYSQIGHRTFIWIGDATGHGASAALVTSAARAVSSIIEFNPSISVGQALRLLNRAIYDTSGGSMMMTFFLASFDPVTGFLNYANASHDPPFRLQLNGKEKIETSDFEPIQDINNPRLGENRDFQFKEGSLKMLGGDRLVLYTDGIVDAANPTGKEWGERRFLESLAKSLGKGAAPKACVEETLTAMNLHRAEAPLNDDATLVIFEWSGRE
jgi:serine phosphatase RsbU (regulator of sigma subunit)